MTLQQFQQRYTYNPSTDFLGGGGFGSVFKAYDTYLDRYVAIKIAKVNPEFESLRLRKEVDMVQNLPDHPNIANYDTCYTFVQMDGEYDFGIMQCYEEGNLLQLLNKNVLTFAQKQSILTQMLDGLSFLHNNGIIHRDLKPQNVLIVNRKGEYIPKITDFGISKQLDMNQSSVVNNSHNAGTWAYASPEQLSTKQIRKNTDLWSFGVIAYQVFTGAQPFTTGGHSNTNSGLVELFRQINSGVLPDAIGGVAEPWQGIIRRCLVADAGKRVRSCEEVMGVLRGEASFRGTDDETKKDPDSDKTRKEPNDDETKKEPPPPITKPPKPKPNPPPEPNKGIIYGIAAFLIVAVLVGGFLWWNSGNNERIAIRQQQEEQMRLAQEAEELRLAEEAEERRQREAEEEAERLRLAREAEQARIAQEQETRRLQEEAERRQREEEEARRREAEQKLEERARSMGGIVINGIIWATRNVGAPGTFATNPESTGLFFQWNRRQGWAIGNITGWDSTDATGTSWTRANDPCPVGWRVPTDGELHSLVISGSTWITHNGVDGRLFGSGGNQIFLPAPGFLSSADGSLSFYGASGRYWASEQHFNERTIHLWFNSHSISVGGSIQRTIGLPVRCVAE